MKLTLRELAKELEPTTFKLTLNGRYPDNYSIKHYTSQGVDTLGNYRTKKQLFRCQSAAEYIEDAAWEHAAWELGEQPNKKLLQIAEVIKNNAKSQ